MSDASYSGNLFGSLNRYYFVRTNTFVNLSLEYILDKLRSFYFLNSSYNSLGSIANLKKFLS